MEQLHVQGTYSFRTLWILIGFLVVAPLSCCQSLDALKYTSSLSMAFIIFLAVMVVLFTFPSYTRLDPCLNFTAPSGNSNSNSNSGPTMCKGLTELYHLDTSSLRALSVFVFGYTCQQVHVKNFL